MHDQKVFIHITVTERRPTLIPIPYRSCKEVRGKAVMDFALLWPVMKESSIANITCAIDVSVQQTSFKTRKRKVVNVYNNKPIVVWMPETEDTEPVSATVAITDCHERNEPDSHFYSFPRSFYWSMFDRGTTSVESSSTLVASDNADVVRQDGPYQFHFMISKTVITLPTVGNESYENNPLAQHSNSRLVCYHGVDKEFCITLLFWFFVLCVTKVFAHKLLRVMKAAYGGGQ